MTSVLLFLQDLIDMINHVEIIITSASAIIGFIIGLFGAKKDKDKEITLKDYQIARQKEMMQKQDDWIEKVINDLHENADIKLKQSKINQKLKVNNNAKE